MLEANKGDGASRGLWHEVDSPIYRYGAVAKQWGMSPREFLSLPSRERRFCELFLVAESMKQKAQLEAQQQQQGDAQDAANFDQRTAAWHSEVQQRWRKMTGH